MDFGKCFLLLCSLDTASQGIQATLHSNDRSTGLTSKIVFRVCLNFWVKTVTQVSFRES
jgi:hypothetical protein